MCPNPPLVVAFVSLILFPLLTYSPNVSANELRTYKNVEFGFSIDYPADWLVQTGDIELTDEHEIVRFRDKATQPNLWFEIIRKDGQGYSFNDFIDKYKDEIASKYAIKIESEGNVVIGNSETYILRYIQYIGETACYYEDYIIYGSNFIPIIQWAICDKDLFENFLPSFDSIVSTFKLVKETEQNITEIPSDVTVNMKIKKKLTLLSFKNNGNIPIYNIEIKLTDGSIRYVKASGWDREKVDSYTIIIKTNDRPITSGRNLLVILIASRIDSGLAWTAFDPSHNIISTGILGEQPKYGQEQAQQREQKQEQSTTQNPANQSESDTWQLIAELQSVSVFGRTVRTETLCVEKLNWAISWTGGVYAVRVHGVDNNFYEEVTNVPNHVIADLKGCFFVFPVSADGGGAIWVYGDKNIAVKKYLPEPDEEFMTRMHNAKRGQVTLGSQPSDYGELGYGDNAYFRPRYGTLGKVAHACFEEFENTQFKPLMTARWGVEGDFNSIRIYRELDANTLELVYETPESKGEILIYDKGCYYGYVDIPSTSTHAFSLSLIPSVTSTKLPSPSPESEITAKSKTDLVNVYVRPLNSLVNIKTSYEITFELGTTGKDVKSEEITFPSGFDISNAKMAKVETRYTGFSHGKLTISGQTLIWDHDIAYRPGCCVEVKMIIDDIVNGETLNNQIGILTRDPNGSIIDGPTYREFLLKST